jgi:hypothetical protein
VSRGRSKETLSIIDAAKKLVSPENPTTVRFLFYKLIMQGVLPENSPKFYERLVNVLRDARLRGDIDDECFADNKRRLESPATWADLEDYRDTIQHLYRRDYWREQSVRPIVCCEKDTVAPVIQQLCNDLQTPMVISSGYFSRPIICKLARYILQQKKPAHIAYIGDNDPSGCDMERALRAGNGEDGTKRREGLFEILMTMADSVQDGADIYDQIKWERLAITDSDLIELQGSQLVPVKMGDPRALGFIRDHGWASEHNAKYFGSEVEALPQEELQDRLRHFIESNIDKEEWKESKRLEEVDTKKLGAIQ